jgi:hypothetical protein
LTVETHDAGASRSDHFDLGSGLQPEFTESLHELGSSDQLAHFGDLSPFEHSQRDQVDQAIGVTANHGIDTQYQNV